MTPFLDFLDKSIRFFCEHLVLFTLVGATWMLGFLPFMLVGIGSLIGLGGLLTEESIPNLVQAYGIAFVLILFFSGVLGLFLLQCISTAALTGLVMQKNQGQPLDWRESFRKALKHLWPLFGTSLLAGLAILCGLLLLIIPGILLALSFYVLPAIVILEDRSGTSALKRAWSLMKGHRWKVFCILFIVGMTQNTLSFMAQISIPFPISLLTQIVLTSIGFSFGQVAIILLYFEAHKERALQVSS